jgi:multimeric flavodoxin WrbA
MNAIILNALDTVEKPPVPELLASLLEAKGWEYEIFPLGEMAIKPCASCGSCNARTPGRCTISDDMQKIYYGWVNSQLVILCTPVSFGGYHSRLKLAIDRASPFNLGYFVTRQGELHHQNRYHPAPSLMTVGILKEDNPREEKTFQYLTERNALNMDICHWASVVVTPQDTMSETRSRIQQALEEVS